MDRLPVDIENFFPFLQKGLYKNKNVCYYYTTTIMILVMEPMPMERVRKRSKKRDAILACIRETDTHPSAEWIYTRLKPQIPDLSLGTVYRNLSMFREE